MITVNVNIPEEPLPYGVIGEFKYSEAQEAFTYRGVPQYVREQQYRIPERDIAHTIQQASSIIHNTSVSAEGYEKYILIGCLVACILTCGFGLVVVIPVLFGVFVVMIIRSSQQLDSALDSFIAGENNTKYYPKGVKFVKTEAIERVDMMPHISNIHHPDKYKDIVVPVLRLVQMHEPQMEHNHTIEMNPVATHGYVEQQSLLSNRAL